MEYFSVLNYQGSKKNLIDFIHDSLRPYINNKSVVFDIFAGTCSVGYSYKQTNTVYANDSEPYAAIISKALLGKGLKDTDLSTFLQLVNRKLNLIKSKYVCDLEREAEFIKTRDVNSLIRLYETVQTIWNTPGLKIDKKGFSLFITHYSTSYFGLQQALEIDAVRATIEHFNDEDIRSALFACLFYAMKECVFSKDGHMAQPLDPHKNRTRLLLQREKSIIKFFSNKFKDFQSENFIISNDSSSYKVFNCDFRELLEDKDVIRNVDVIYADPPYTDMQYSRYYHLLNTVVKYDYSVPTLNHGKPTKGLYLENRYQSKLSQRSNCLKELKQLVLFSKKHNKTLALSFAYPQDTKKQKTDRYVIEINELISVCQKIYGNDSVIIKEINYTHSNNRNSETKKVLEYLIICSSIEKNISSIDTARTRIHNAIPSKDNPLYNSHMYWSQKPYNICDILIEELSLPGDTVYDPFMGSGVTVLEAVKNQYNRIGIGCEINEAPLFIVKTLLQELTVKKYHDDAVKLVGKIKQLNEKYQTECPICHAQGIITNTIFDLKKRNSDAVLKQINYICPNCKRQQKLPDENDIENFNKKYAIECINNISLIENSKLAVYANEHISDIFTKRNFKILDDILKSINEFHKNKDLFRYVLMSILHLCKITDTHSNSQWPLWIPKSNCVEKNIVEIFCKRILKFEDTIRFIEANYSSSKKFKLLNKGSQYVTASEIPDNSVKLIITDPPYLGQVAYSEYMQLYQPFLGFKFNLVDEIVVSSSPLRNKGKEDYFALLDAVVENCSRKIINGGYLCMYFHDSNLEVWNKLIKIMSNNGFKYISQEHINKTITLKNILSPKKSLIGDAILFFIKESFRYQLEPAKESLDEIEANIVAHIKAILRKNGAQSTPELYDRGLIEYLIYNDWLEPISKQYKTLVEIFEKFLFWNNNKWELRD